jgi:multidrug efflux pump subunit AcrB
VRHPALFPGGPDHIIGLSAKNTILIIEFCQDLQAEGKGLVQTAWKRRFTAVSSS